MTNKEKVLAGTPFSYELKTIYYREITLSIHDETEIHRCLKTHFGDNLYCWIESIGEKQMKVYVWLFNKKVTTTIDLNKIKFIES